MNANHKLKRYLLLAPICVLLFAKAAGEISIRLLSSKLSWLPAFGGYYLAIVISIVMASKVFKLGISDFSLKPIPNRKHVLWLIVVPALLPLYAFIINVKYITPAFMLYIVLFALINPFFEEGFWRGLLTFLPGGKTFRVLYTAGLFAFSHYFLWGYWFKSWWVIGPAVISTFIMGTLWMLFMNRYTKIAYPIISHIIVDILNLSVAVYYGMVTFGH